LGGFEKHQHTSEARGNLRIEALWVSRLGKGPKRFVADALDFHGRLISDNT
jgi:hypothetical protein